MKTTRYFEEQVLPRRPHIQRSWCLQTPVAQAVQRDGRFRRWVRIDDAPRDGQTRFLRVVLLEDGETIHNAFFDRGFQPPQREATP